MLFKNYLVTLALLLFSIAGCSSGKSSPVIPVDPQPDINIPATELNTDASSHTILGTWTLSINHETFEATVTPNRTLNVHHNVTSMIPDPLIIINSWDPIEEVADVDIQIHNDTWISVYDVRLIIYTDDAGHELLNDDNWTPLWDIPGGQIANPFKAYAKYEPNRIFTGENWHQENFRIRCPGSNFNVQFAVDVSYPGNCDEPYEISNFEQGVLYEDIGANTTVTVDVLDWQNDVSEVYLHCPEITNEPETPLEFVSVHKWQLNLTNNAGASAGEYSAIIYAESTGSAGLKLFNQITITINETVSGIPLNPQVTGFISFPYFCMSVTTQGDYAYIEDQYAGIKIVDLTDIYNPEITGIVGIRDFDSDYSISGPFPHNEYIFCNQENNGLAIADIGNPREPEIVSELVGINFSEDIKFRGNQAFFRGTSRMNIWDISNIYSLEFEGGISYDGASKAWDILGNYVFSTQYAFDTRESGLVIIDISDPANMEQVGFFQTESNIEEIEFAGDYAYLINTMTADSILILDISDPINPYEVNEIDLGRVIDSFEVSGNYLYCIENADWFFILDITDPQNPSQVGEMQIPDYWNLSFSGNVPCVWGSKLFATLDVSDPNNPGIAGVLHIGGVSDFEISGNNLYASIKPQTGVTSENPGLKIFDITNPEEPLYVSSYLTYGHSIAANNDIVYLMQGLMGSTMQIIDASDPANPNTIGTLGGFQGDNEELLFEGDCVYASGSFYMSTYIMNGKFQRANVSDPTEPYHTGEIDDIFVEGIDVWGTNALVSSKMYKLNLIDLSDPLEIEIIHDYGDINISGFHISDSKLYCVILEGSTRYFRIYDISVPSAPVKLGEIRDQKATTKITVSGNYAYLQNRGLTCIDISDSQNPVVVSDLDLQFTSYSSGGSSNIHVSDKYSFLRREYFGITIIKLWD